MKRAISFILATVLLLGLCACGGGKEPAASSDDGSVVGTWEGSWTYNGADIHRILTICEDGTFSSKTERNGSPSGENSGTWVLSGDLLTLQEPGGILTDYDFNGSTLVNNGHEMKK